MKIKFLILFLFSISSFLHSQGITSIYSFDVNNQNDIPKIVQAMTEHFETDFAKAGVASVEIVEEHFNGKESSNISFVYNFKDIQEMQDEYSRVLGSEEIEKVHNVVLPLVEEDSQMLLRNIVGGKGVGKTSVSMVFVMNVNNPNIYLKEYTKLINTIEENGKSELFTEYGLSEIFAGGQEDPKATHHAVIGAVDMVSLVNGLDELFGSSEFADFNSNVSGNRSVLSRKIVFSLATFND